MSDRMFTAVVGGTIATVLGGVFLAWMQNQAAAPPPTPAFTPAAPSAPPTPTPTVFFQHQDGLAFCRARGYAIYHYSRHKEGGGGGVVHHCDMARGVKSKGQQRCEQDYPNSTFLYWLDEARGKAQCRLG